MTDAPVAASHRVIRMASHPDGALEDDDFDLVDERVPEPADGEALVRTLYLSLDPAIRVWMNGIDTYVPGIQVGDVMRAGGLGEVVQSRNAAYTEGDLVFGMMQWSEYCIARAGPDGMMTLPRQEPITAFLSVLGVTGLTAYFGMFDVAQPKEGETVVVSGAAGAVGSVAGQIGKIIGCRVVGIAGGPEKCAWITDELGFDAWIDYKSEDVAARLRETCPDGIDVFFDNVGGEILDAVLGQINLHARIALCGAISQYDTAELSPGPRNFINLIPQRGRVEGFILLDYRDRFLDAILQLGQWVQEGRIRYAEDIVDGLDNAPAAFRRLFTGENTGKLIVKVAE
ncbi:MAG TPA: NADP-dependent oxidoreductase [Acidimicrobiia bacterium]|nr:NADP-dependent oxidoreductase [Acidimicrobiia bacterium]